jgi:hypothetical protein
LVGGIPAAGIDGRLIDQRFNLEGRFRAVFLFSVPELTRSADIKLKKRVWLQGYTKAIA